MRRIEQLKETVMYNIYGNGYDADVRANNILEAVEELYEKPMKWEKVCGVVTPGGDPCYICPVCHSGKSEHLHGIEFLTTSWNFCPICGTRLKYHD